MQGGVAGAEADPGGVLGSGIAPGRPDSPHLTWKADPTASHWAFACSTTTLQSVFLSVTRRGNFSLLLHASDHIHLLARVLRWVPRAAGAQTPSGTPRLAAFLSTALALRRSRQPSTFQLCSKTHWLILTVQDLRCHMGDLVPWTRNFTWGPALEARRLSRWAIWEVSTFPLLK